MYRHGRDIDRGRGLYCSPHLMVAQGSGHGQAPRPDTEGSYRAPLHSTGAELPAKLTQSLALGFVVIQSVVATHLYTR